MNLKKSSYQKLKEKLYLSDYEAKVGGERLRVALRNLNIVVAHLDAELKYQWIYNPGRILLPEDAIGKRDEDLLPLEEAAKLIEFKKNVLAKGHEDSREVEIQLDSNRMFFSLNAEPIYGPDGSIAGMTFAALDITEQRKREEVRLEYQEKLKGLAIERALLEGKERRRIAQALHDELGQYLTLAKIELGALREAALPEDADRQVSKTMEMIECALQETRAMTFELSPPVLFNLGLEPAIEWLLEQRLKKPGIQYRLEHEEELIPLDKDTRILLFQIVRELITNVIKHAKARQVVVQIYKRDSEIEILMEDDGVGFDPASVISPKGEMFSFGLFSIRQRLEFIGGTFRIDSSAGAGTRVRIAAPLSF